MANQASITVRVTAARGSSTISYTTKGRYVSFTTSGYQRQLLQEPVQPTSSLDAFWASVLNEVLADMAANPPG